MPVFILEPVDVEHNDWRASSHKDRCRVIAPDEEAARIFASFAFSQMHERIPGRDLALSPWENTERVTAQLAMDTANQSGDSYPKIEVPDYRASPGIFDDFGGTDDMADFNAGALWKEIPDYDYIDLAKQYLEARSIDSDELLEESAGDRGDKPEVGVWGKSKWNEAVWGDGKDTIEQAHTDVDEVGNTVVAEESDPNSAPTNEIPVGEAAKSHDVVRKVIANRQILAFQSQTLLNFLERMDQPGIGNEGGIQPLVREDDDELKALLHILIDELRTFNALLKQDKPELKVIETSTDGFKEAGRNWLKKFTSSNGTRTGDLVAGVLATFLVSADLLDPAFATMIIGGQVAKGVMKKGKGTDEEQ